MDSTTMIYFSSQNIETTITSRAATVDSWVSSIRSLCRGKQMIVGLDCEWRPNTNTFMNNMTSVLQLCVGTKCLMVQLFHMDRIPQSLKDFLSDSNVTCVGVEVQRDADKIEFEYGLVCARVVDVRELAVSQYRSLALYRRPGLKDVAFEVAGLIMPKPKNVTRSDWQAMVLSDEQIEYACIDAYASYRIGLKLLR